MVIQNVRDVPRPEAEIARRVRKIVGPDVPIAGSFDLHGNEDEQFFEWDNAAFVTTRLDALDYEHAQIDSLYLFDKKQPN